jgi:hypothetical protein
MIDRQTVINAFAKTPRPDDSSLCVCTCEECEWEVARFRGKKWPQLTIEDFCAEDGDANVTFLTPAAFQYFLPGLILLIGDDAQLDWLVHRILARLTVSDQDDESRRESTHQVIKRLNSSQRQTLVHVVSDWRQRVPCAPAIWDALISSLHDGAVRCFAVREVEEYNTSVLKNR